MEKAKYLVENDYMADPAVHVFNGRLYIYPSHDRESGIPENDNGDHFDMNDYHVFSTSDIESEPLTDHGIVLKVNDIKWSGRQLWDCDVAFNKDKYYFSYSTGDSHYLCYAIGDNPYGPFTYKGVILTSVVGWTTHHSIVEFKGKWYLFHHDSVPSGGKTWLRSLKVVELEYDENDQIKTIEGRGF